MMAIQVGIAPDSWGVWFPKHEKQPSWDRCLDEMAEAGYAGVELGPWGYFPNTASVLRQELDKRNLVLVAGTIGGNFLDEDSVQAMLKTVDEMAPVLQCFAQAKYIVMLPPMYTDLETGELAMNPELTDEEWQRYAGNVQRVANHIAGYGLVGTFHPHVDSHVQTEAQIERLLQDTDVMLCLDTGHHVYGGGEPISFYEKHADRIPYIHIKDCDLAVKAKMDEEHWSFAKAVTENIMVEPGNGSIDFKKFHNALVKKNYDGWCVVEQDLFPVKSFDIPLKLAKHGRENLRVAGFC